RTVAASASDPRFKPLSGGDGPVTLEISLLTPATRLRSWAGFRLGRGAVLLLNGKGGTLLPQVATEMGWDEREFLENLSKKAGLQPHAYKSPDARLYVFEAQVFSESETTAVD
ncbi:MAG: AMMECR1 domain-containing protein, partial [bacterium]|nr:AMMECR1 domain-containing protein [bacterium]